MIRLRMEGTMDKKQLSAIIEENGKAVYSFCCHLTGSRELADELYQDTFLKVWELCHKIEQNGNPKSYIMGIAIKLWQNQKRKQAVRKRLVTLEEYREEKVLIYENLPEQEAIRKEQQEMVKQTVAELPEKIRTVLYLFYTAELSLQEISETIFIPVGTVKSRLNKGRNQVKKRMEVYMDEQADGRRVVKSFLASGGESGARAQ